MQIFANQSSKIPCLYRTSKCCWAWFSLRVYPSLTGPRWSKHTKAPAPRRKAFQHPPNHFHSLKQLLAHRCFRFICQRLFCPKHWITMESSIQGLLFPDLFETWLFPLLTFPQPLLNFTSWFLGFQLSPLLLWILTVPLLCFLEWHILFFLGFCSKELIPFLVFLTLLLGP